MPETSPSQRTPWSRIGVVAHRGASSIAPENTMAAFAAATALGATGIEFDVHQTVDGDFAVVHDFDLSRTTNGTGAVFESRWSDLADLDAGRWFGDGFAGERVPRLEDVLELSGLDFELEIKGFGRGIADRVLDAVDRADVMGRVKFTGWNVLLLKEIKRRRPEAAIGLFSRGQEPWMTDAMFEHTIVGTASTSGFDVAHVLAKDMKPSIGRGLRAAGLVVHANDVGRGVQADLVATQAEALRALRAGADHLSGNDVSAMLAAANLHLADHS